MTPRRASSTASSTAGLTGRSCAGSLMYTSVEGGCTERGGVGPALARALRPPDHSVALDPPVRGAGQARGSMWSALLDERHGPPGLHGDLDRARGLHGELPVDLATVASVHNQDHEPVVIQGVHDPVVLRDPDPPYTVHARQHSGARRPRVIPLRFGDRPDPLGDGTVELSQRADGLGSEFQRIPLGSHESKPSSAQTRRAGMGSAPASISASASLAAWASAKSSSSSRNSSGVRFSSSAASSAGTIAAKRPPRSVRVAAFPPRASLGAAATSPGGLSSGISLIWASVEVALRSAERLATIRAQARGAPSPGPSRGSG